MTQATHSSTKTPAGNAGNADLAKQAKAALSAMIALTEAIRELGSVPSGHLYATVMGQMSLEVYESLLGRIVGTGLVEKQPSGLLVWRGPKVDG